MAAHGGVTRRCADLTRPVEHNRSSRDGTPPYHGGAENVLMFSGQGSQYFTMGQPLYEANPAFRRHLDALDVLAVSRTGRSVVDAIHRSGRKLADPFDDIALSNPAIFMVELALARALIEHGVRVDKVLGASLGTFAALAVADALDDDDALRAVMRVADAATRYAPRGAMIAVVAPAEVAQAPFLQARSEVAAIHFASHLVLAVAGEQIDAVEGYLADRDILFQRLPVGFAFHSRQIEALREPVRGIFDDMRLRPLRLPLACCAHAATLTELPREFLWTVLRHPIRFKDTLLALERERPWHYVDAGPSGTLATFAKYLLPAESGARISHVLTPYGRDAELFARLVAARGTTLEAGRGTGW